MRRVRDFGVIHLHKASVDGRKQINGLAQFVQGAMGSSPFGGLRNGRKSEMESAARSML